MSSIIGNIGPSVESFQHLYNQGGVGVRTLALGGWTWTANPAASTHLSGLTNPLETNAAPSALAIPANATDWGYTNSKYGYDTGGVTLLLSPANGKTEIKNVDDAATPMSIQFICTGPGGTGTAFLYVEFMGRVLFNAVGNANYTLDLTPAESGWLLTGGGSLKYRMYAMNNENQANVLQVNILGANGIVATHLI
jgi:hypothetical protein